MVSEQAHAANTGIIILAAGQSSRLGSPKQLLSFSGTTLLQHAIEVAQESDASSVLVVLGSNAAIIKDELQSIKAAIIQNDEWKEGVASSIRLGLQTFVKQYPQTEAILFMVADQPFVTTELINNLLNVYRKKQHSIVASEYGDTFGTPVLLDSNFFPELMQLTGDKGAKSIVRKHLNAAAFVPFPKGEIDIDTAEDYMKLKDVRFKE